jgi:hypothetical protein
MIGSIKKRFHGAVCIACLGAAACSSSTPTDTKPVTSLLPGAYTVTWIRSAASCAPQALPSAMIADTTQYAAIPNGSATYQLAAQTQLNASVVSIVPQNAAGAPISAFTLSGTLLWNDSAYLSRSSTLNEGPRAGGHTFVVTETSADSGEFISIVGFGAPVAVLLTARGRTTFAFHDGGVSGPVFTTCAVADTVKGQKNTD